MATSLFRAVILLVGFFWCAEQAAAATFTSELWYGRRYHINLVGRIDAGDDKLFQAEVLSQIRSGHLISALQLYTPGGDVGAAISIGEQSRLLGLATVAPFQDQSGFYCRYGAFDNENRVRNGSCTCQSACFIIWAAGIGRYGDYLGIHHPYFNKDMYGSLPPDRAQELYTGMENRVRQYLMKMSIADSIVDKMFNYISRDMYFLTKEEVATLSNEPAWEKQYLYDKCGTLPLGSVYRNADRKAFIDCQSAVIESELGRSSQKYLDLYGSAAERVPNNGAAATIPQRPAQLVDPPEIAKTSSSAQRPSLLVEMISPTKIKVLGIEFANLTEDVRIKLSIEGAVQGVAVTSVETQSAAFDKGLRTGDIIFQVSQNQVRSVDDMVTLLNNLRNSAQKSALIAVKSVGTTGRDAHFMVLPLEP